MSIETVNALAIIDVETCFFPASESIRLGLPGFGELPVAGAEVIVPRINRLTRAIGKSATKGIVAATLDQHPEETAHFSDTPNFVDTWPHHGREGTPGAMLHPELTVAQHPELATVFIKGDKPCATPEEDTSYTGALAYDPKTGLFLPEFLRNHDPSTVYVAGLALGDGEKRPLCVDSTACDLHEMGFNVVLVTDAVEAVLSENRELCLSNLAKLGIRLVTTEQAVGEIMGGQ